MDIFKIQGQVHHRIGCLYPLPNETHNFLQVYLVSAKLQQTEQRCTISTHKASFSLTVARNVSSRKSVCGQVCQNEIRKP